jgi:hypothetical protein
MDEIYDTHAMSDYTMNRPTAPIIRLAGYSMQPARVPAINVAHKLYNRQLFGPSRKSGAEMYEVRSCVLLDHGNTYTMRLVKPDSTPFITDSHVRLHNAVEHDHHEH